MMDSRWLERFIWIFSLGELKMIKNDFDYLKELEIEFFKVCKIIRVNIKIMLEILMLVINFRCVFRFDECILMF